MPYSTTLDTGDPIGVIYRFMTDPLLFRPEVTLAGPFSDDLIILMADNLPPEQEFRRACIGKVVMAVAAFDEDDADRVNLAYVNGLLQLSVYKPGDKAKRDELCGRLM